MTATSPRLMVSDTLRSRFARVLHATGIKESPSVWAGSEADSPSRLLSGAKPVQTQGLLRVRPSDTRQFVGSGRCPPIKTAVHQQYAQTGLAGPRQQTDCMATNRVSGQHSEASEGETRRRARMATVPAISSMLTGKRMACGPMGMSLTAMGGLFPDGKQGRGVRKLIKYLEGQA